MDYKEYEQKTEKLEAENQKYLDEFRLTLKEAGLAEKTIHKHVDNMEFFLNVYLPRDDCFSTLESVSSISSFLGYFLPNKVIGPASMVRDYAASLKKFFKMMYEKGYISKEDYREAQEDLKTPGSHKKFYDDMARDFFGYDDD